MNLNRTRLFFACAILFACAGCETTRGPRPIIAADGVLESRTGGMASRFIDSERAAASAPNSKPAAAAMLNDGFTLVYANCSDYFRSAGSSQKWLIFSRDVVAAVGTLAASAMALHGSSRSAIANVSMVSGATFVGIDTYTKDFLFAAENIESVRTLTTKALTAHQTGVLDLGPLDYRGVLIALSDHQDICSPMSIAALARDAIKRGDVTAVDTSTGLKQVTSAVDAKALATLGGILRPPGPLSVDEAGALWWLLKESNTKDEQSNYIFPKLAALPSTSAPMKTSGAVLAYDPNWAARGSVSDALESFSQRTKDEFRAVVETQKEAEKKAASDAATAATEAAAKNAAAPAILPAPALPFVLGTPSASKASGHVDVIVRSTNSGG
jgi:hypothetical protein